MKSIVLFLSLLAAVNPAGAAGDEVPAASPADVGGAPEPVAAPRIVAAPVARDVRDDLAAEANKASRTAWGWTAVAVGSGIYAGVVLAGSGGNQPVLKYLSFVGVLAGLAGAARGMYRAHECGELRGALDEAINTAAGDPGIRISGATAAGVNAELHGRLTALRNESRGALRAGCVLPVLLGGIGIYGLAANSAGGDELAGVGLGGALVIGAPSMLSYIGLQGRMKRMEGLVTRWDEALQAQEMSK